MLSDILFRTARWVMPEARREWVDAMQCEATHAGRRSNYALACVRTAFELRWKTSDKAALSLCLVLVSLVVSLEWHTDEVLLVLAALLAASFAGGLLMPGHWLTFGIAPGFSIAAGHLLLDLPGLSVPHYEVGPPSLVDFGIMFMLPIPALIAAFAGRMVRRRLAGLPR